MTFIINIIINPTFIKCAFVTIHCSINREKVSSLFLWRSANLNVKKIFCCCHFMKGDVTLSVQNKRRKKKEEDKHLNTTHTHNLNKNVTTSNTIFSVKSPQIITVDKSMMTMNDENFFLINRGEGLED